MSAEIQTHRIAVVTGAGGFIASHLTERLLREGYRVRALVHYNALGSRAHLEEVVREGSRRGETWAAEDRLEIIHGDVLDERCMRELITGANQVFHLAALIGIPYSYRAPGSYMQVNTQGTLNVLEACRDAGPERVIVTSTSEVYGTALEVPISEAHPLQAQSPYSASKIAADKFAQSYHLSFDLPVVTIRPFNTYGPRQSARAIVPTVLAQAISEDCKEIRLGSLDPVRDLTYVEDTAAAFVALAEAPREKVVGQTFNVGTGHGHTIGEIAELALAAAADPNTPLEERTTKPIVSDVARIRPDKSEVGRLIADATKLRKALGWKPEVTLEDGLARTCRWLRDHMDLYRPGSYRV